ncbi:MAG TPA: RIO1 family regulatory kinase/ATPase, partial [Thermoplasmata archaeon]|nr:RIO1 family regulatory kinase/ATPase [Thermoplasmata archaeon]
MIDERSLHRLETQVDALRTREKDSDALKTYDQVFDRACLLVLQELINDGVIATLDYPVSTGKEAVVFHATDAAGKGFAVKIYRVTNSTFKTIAVYIEGDARFKRVKKATKPTIFAWAQKEFQNLVRMQD